MGGWLGDGSSSKVTEFFFLNFQCSVVILIRYQQQWEHTNKQKTMLKRIRQVNEIDILNEIFQQNVKEDKTDL